MKLGQYTITLSKKTLPKVSGDEQGGSGSPTPSNLAFQEFLGATRQPTITQIMSMIDNDGTAQGLFSMLKFPVLATNWHIEPDPEDINSRSRMAPKPIRRRTLSKHGSGIPSIRAA